MNFQNLSKICFIIVLILSAACINLELNSNENKSNEYQTNNNNNQVNKINENSEKSNREEKAINQDTKELFTSYAKNANSEKDGYYKYQLRYETPNQTKENNILINFTKIKKANTIKLITDTKSDRGTTQTIDFQKNDFKISCKKINLNLSNTNVGFDELSCRILDKSTWSFSLSFKELEVMVDHANSMTHNKKSFAGLESDCFDSMIVSKENASIFANIEYCFAKENGALTYAKTEVMQKTNENENTLIYKMEQELIEYKKDAELKDLKFPYKSPILEMGCEEGIIKLKMAIADEIDNVTVEILNKTTSGKILLMSKTFELRKEDHYSIKNYSIDANNKCLKSVYACTDNICIGRSCGVSSICYDNNYYYKNEKDYSNEIGNNNYNSNFYDYKLKIKKVTGLASEQKIEYLFIQVEAEEKPVNLSSVSISIYDKKRNNLRLPFSNNKNPTKDSYGANVIIDPKNNFSYTNPIVTQENKIELIVMIPKEFELIPEAPLSIGVHTGSYSHNIAFTLPEKFIDGEMLLYTR